MTYTILARTESGRSKVLFAGQSTRAAVIDAVRQAKRTFPTWSLTAYRLIRKRNVESPVYRA